MEATLRAVALPVTGENSVVGTGEPFEWFDWSEGNFWTDPGGTIFGFGGSYFKASKSHAPPEYAPECVCRIYCRYAAREYAEAEPIVPEDATELWPTLDGREVKVAHAAIAADGTPWWIVETVRAEAKRLAEEA